MEFLSTIYINDICINMDIKERFYEGIKEIVLSVYPWGGKFLEDDENGRGSNEDDVIYAILEKAKSKMSNDECDFRQGIFRKVIKLATHLYCTDKGIKDISEDLDIWSTSEDWLNVSYMDYDTAIEYRIDYHPDILFEIIRLDRNHTDVEAVVPKFLKNGVSYDNSKNTYIRYYNDRVVVNYGLPDENEMIMNLKYDKI